jgi:hypothetical protein
MSKSLPPELADAPMTTFSIVSAYMLMTWLSEAAVTAAWRVATRIPVKLAGTSWFGSTTILSLTMGLQSRRSGMPSPSVSLSLVNVQVTWPPTARGMLPGMPASQTALDSTQPVAALSPML